MSTFDKFHLNKDLLTVLEKTHFKTPTPIQDKAIPIALSGRDLVGIAQTGTGKTAAFLLPALTHLLSGKKKQLLVLTPTRELAVQITEVLHSFARTLSQIKSALLIGGAGMGKQLNQLQRKANVIVATPGRLNDHLKRGSLKFSSPLIVVVDEMDRMLDMGFLPQLREAFKHVPKDRQTMMFSATFPSTIKNLVEEHTNNAEKIAIDSAPKASENIVQSHMEVPGPEKNDRILQEIKKRQGAVLIFTRTKIRADRLARFLKTNSIKTTAIHGDRSQNQRQDAIKGFLDGRYDVLVATDIASRGLDIPSIELVVNFDLPETREDYIHRIGRTARGGANGLALSLVTPEEMPHWNWINKTGGTQQVHKRGGGKQGGRSQGRSFGGSSRGGQSQGHSGGKSKRPFRHRKGSGGFRLQQDGQKTGHFRSQGPKKAGHSASSKPAHARHSHPKHSHKKASSGQRAGFSIS